MEAWLGFGISCSFRLGALIKSKFVLESDEEEGCEKVL
jgi:hypothetical protein